MRLTPIELTRRNARAPGPRLYMPTSLLHSWLATRPYRPEEFYSIPQTRGEEGKKEKKSWVGVGGWCYGGMSVDLDLRPAPRRAHTTPCALRRIRRTAILRGCVLRRGGTTVLVPRVDRHAGVPRHPGDITGGKTLARTRSGSRRRMRRSRRRNSYDAQTFQRLTLPRLASPRHDAPSPFYTCTLHPESIYLYTYYFIVDDSVYPAYIIG